MKTCEHCFSTNEDSASACARCGGQRFKEELNVPAGGEKEVFGWIARGSEGRWRAEDAGLDLQDLMVKPPSLPLEMAGAFKVRTPNGNGKEGSTLFDSDKKGGSGTLRIGRDDVALRDTVTLEHKPGGRIAAGCLMALSALMLLGALIAPQGPEGVQLFVVILAVLLFAGAIVGYLVRYRQGVPDGVMTPLTKSLVSFLLAGVTGVSQSGIDFAAHFGGLLSGLIFGFMAARPLDLAQRQAVTWKSVSLLGASMATVIAVWVSQLPPLGMVTAQFIRRGQGNSAPVTPADALSKTNAQAVAEAIRIQMNFSRLGKDTLINQAHADIRSNQVTLIADIADAVIGCDTALCLLGSADNRPSFDTTASRIQADCSSVSTNSSALSEAADSWRRRTQAGNQKLDAKTVDQITKVVAVDLRYDEKAVQMQEKIAQAGAAYVGDTTNLIGFLDAHWGEWRQDADNTPAFGNPGLAASYTAQRQQFQKANDNLENLLLSPKQIALLRQFKTMTATNAPLARAFAAGIAMGRAGKNGDAAQIRQAMSATETRLRALALKLDSALADCTNSFDFKGLTTLDQYRARKKLADDACAILGEFATASGEPLQWARSQFAAAGVDVAFAEPFLEQIFDPAQLSVADGGKGKQLGEALATYVQNVTNLHALLLANWGRWQVNPPNAVQFSTPALDTAYRSNVAGMAAAGKSLAVWVQNSFGLSVSGLSPLLFPRFHGRLGRFSQGAGVGFLP